MTTFLLTHKIEARSIQKATAMRDKCAEYLQADDDVQVIQSDVGQQDRHFKVVGVDVAGKQPFAQDVEAADEEAARKKVATSTKIVAEVTGL